MVVGVRLRACARASLPWTAVQPGQGPSRISGPNAGQADLDADGAVIPYTPGDAIRECPSAGHRVGRRVLDHLLLRVGRVEEGPFAVPPVFGVVGGRTRRPCQAEFFGMQMVGVKLVSYREHRSRPVGGDGAHSVRALSEHQDLPLGRLEHGFRVATSGCSSATAARSSGQFEFMVEPIGVGGPRDRVARPDDRVRHRL